jgi:hypothetical protein
VSGIRSGLNVIEGSARFGYRHVIGPAVGLEFLVDGGPAYSVPDQGSGRMNGVIGGSFALVIGF